MYRCHPQTHKVKELADSGIIGDVLMIQSEFGFAAGREWDNFRADGALGGGGLMDVGTYCVSFCRLIMGREPNRLHYVAEITDRGYDASGAGCMGFPNGATAHFGTGIHVDLRNDATIYGTKGRIHVDWPWKCSQGKITVSVKGGEEQQFQLNSTNDELYAIEADTVAEFMEQGQCPYMTIDDTIDNMRALDGLRQSAGLRFAAEATA